jgi:hypothetical protein
MPPPRDQGRAPLNLHLVGGRGSGKTYVAIAEAQRRPKVVIVDPTRQVRWRYTTTDPSRVAATLGAHRVCDIAVHCAPDEDSADQAVVTVIEAAREDPEWVTVVIDELALYGRGAKDAVQKIGRIGRHDRVALIIAGQRAVDANTGMRAIMDAVIIYPVAGASEYEEIRRMGGRDLVEAVQSLPRHHAVVFHAGRGTWHVRTAQQLAAGDFGVEALEA